MSLGTLDRTPPPFFRQGPSALTKLLVCAALALFLMVADTRFTVVAPLRAAVATALLPVQRVLLWPVQAIAGGGDYLRALDEARAAEQAAHARMVRLEAEARRADRLAEENEALRRLLALAPALPPRQTAAEVLFEARDAYSHKLVLSRGQAQGVQPSSVALAADGVLGQVTRVYPLSAELTLLTDKDARVPVFNARTRQRAVAYGGARGAAGPMLEVRFLSADADVQAGDLWLTNGLDGIYPAGWPVGTATEVDRRADSGFTRVRLTPATTGEGVRHVLLLAPVRLPAGAAEVVEAAQAAQAAQTAQAAASAAAPAGRPGLEASGAGAAGADERRTRP
jgi:rod shape-determining protein MreC